VSRNFDARPFLFGKFLLYINSASSGNFCSSRREMPHQKEELYKREHDQFKLTCKIWRDSANVTEAPTPHIMAILEFLEGVERRLGKEFTLEKARGELTKLIQSADLIRRELHPLKH